MRSRAQSQSRKPYKNGAPSPRVWVKIGQNDTSVSRQYRSCIAKVPLHAWGKYCQRVNIKAPHGQTCASRYKSDAPHRHINRLRRQLKNPKDKETNFDNGNKQSTSSTNSTNSTNSELNQTQGFNKFAIENLGPLLFDRFHSVQKQLYV